MSERMGFWDFLDSRFVDLSFTLVLLAAIGGCTVFNVVRVSRMDPREIKEGK